MFNYVIKLLIIIMIYQQNKNKNENVEEKNTKCIYEIRRVSILVIMERRIFGGV